MLILPCCEFYLKLVVLQVGLICIGYVWGENHFIFKVAVMRNLIVISLKKVKIEQNHGGLVNAMTSSVDVYR